MVHQQNIYVRIFINTFAQFGTKAVSVILSLLTVGLLTRYLGTEGYGDFTLVFTYISLFAVLSDIGFNQILVREFASQKEKTSETLATYLNLKLILTGIALLLPMLVLPFFPYPSYLKLAILLGGVAVMVGNLVAFGTSILQSQLRLDLVAYLDLFMKFITVLVIYWFIQMGLSIYYILFAVLIGNLFGLISTYVLIKKHIVFKIYLDISLVKRLLKLGLPVGISSFLAVLYFKVDTLMLSVMRSPAEVGIYGLSFKLFDNILMVWALFMASIFPLWSKYFAQSEHIKYRKLLRNTLFTLFGLSLLIIFCGYAFTPLIMRILGGSKFFSSMLPFKILLLAVPFLFLNNVFYNVILSFGKTKFLIQPLIISLIVNILLNLYAIPQYGYIGASYVTVATEVLTSMTYVFILFTKFKTEATYLGMKI